MPLILSALLANSSVIESWPPPRDQTIVVTAPGNQIDDDDATLVRSSDLERLGSADLTGALARSSAAVSLSEAQANPYQPNLVYHGFEASPLQGTAQGLAVYVDGGRFNLPFGDTVNFDLIPPSAIKRATIKDTSPVYGLNALGGILAVDTKNGRDAKGGEASVLAGDHGRAEGMLQLAGTRGEFSGYLALDRRHDGGWRVRSPSDLTNGFVDVGWDGSGAGVHLKAITADADLTGNGPAPVELLAADRQAVFTTPDRTINRYRRLSVHPYLDLGERTRLTATAYAQHLRQRTINGDMADVEPCSLSPALLCLEDQPLTDEHGIAIAARADAARYGVLNRSLTHTTSAGALVQVNDRRHLLAGENELIAGFSYDRSHTRFDATTELGVLAPDREIVGLGAIIDQSDGAVAPVSLTSETSYVGLFVSDTLPITSRLEAELGAVGTTLGSIFTTSSEPVSPDLTISLA